jgi:hypothetical protein
MRASFPPGKHNGLQIPKPVTPSFMKLVTEFSYRFWQALQYPPISSRDTTNPKAAVALDLPLELFAEKNLAHAPWEFGYAVGGSHILASASSAKPCALCHQRFAGGAEA